MMTSAAWAGSTPARANSPIAATTGRTEGVHNAGCQRGFRADDGEGNFFLLHKGNQFLDIGDRQVFNTFGTRGTAIARGNVDSLHACRLGQAPCQGVFTAAAADNK